MRQNPLALLWWEKALLEAAACLITALACKLIGISLIPTILISLVIVWAIDQVFPERKEEDTDDPGF
jgi:hypothetical protein